MGKFSKASLFLTACTSLVFSFVEAKDFGERGHVFEIEEENILQYLKTKMNSIDPSERESMEDSVRKRAIKSVREPKAVSGLEEARHYRSFYFDPTVTAYADIPDSDVLDAEGKLLVAKGSVVAKGSSVNPLHMQELRENLLFIDGDKPSHLEFARSQEMPCKWILTKGKPLDLEEEEKRAVFFDQLGVLVKKLGIEKIPALVSQEGNSLKIEEIPLEGGKR